MGKVSLVSEKLDLEVDWSKQPWQTIKTMKDFRNALVHLKPKKTAAKYVFVKKTIDLDLVPRYALLIDGYPTNKKSLMSYVSIENMEKFIDAASELEAIS